nr:M23 family metallopeptidase [Cytophaga sp. FL35]
MGLKSLFVVIFCCLILGCNQVRKVTDIITQSTARELYERNLQRDSLLFTSWKNDFERSLLDSLEVPLPYVENGYFYTKSTVARSYKLELQKGEILNIKVLTDTLDKKIFINLFEKDENFNSILSNESGERNLSYKVEKNGIYKLVVQPEIYGTAPFQLELYTEPSFAFPVLGKSNKAIISFWGASRDGGRRSHEGIDVFAERGTPVLAVTSGRVSSVTNKGLGGKQVWQRTGFLGLSLYYAHLDSILVKTGQKLKVGDTLGLVGNTGNARTTAPHLHFGIYDGYKGAIDPLPFVKMRERPLNTELKSSPNGKWAVIAASRANIRQGPATAYSKIGEVRLKDSLQVLGFSGNWVHIKFKEQRAFVHQSLLSIGQSISK